MTFIVKSRSARTGLVALALLLPVPAAATVRALFVGVNQYQFSKAHPDRAPNAEFNDLKGTLNDVRHIKDALRATYGLNLDEAGVDCKSSNGVSTTLTDACATRAAILGALEGRIAESAPGDTVLFFFAGHGAQVRDDAVFDQPSGNDTTILPTDSRPPEEDELVEILDRKLGAIIDGANARGVNIVTIFDSCYSESGTRDLAEGQARDAPRRDIKGLAKSAPLARPFVEQPAAGKGYRVHLAAAREEEKAHEVGKGADTAGVFTTKLTEALKTLPGATFEDILAETRRLVEESGQTTQSPRGDGALRARLGGADSTMRLIEAAAKNGQVRLLGGKLSGVTAGSRYALFDGSTAATADGAPLVMATVTQVSSKDATLALDPGAVTLKPRLIAKETKHAFGTRDLLIRNAATGADRARVSAAIAATGMAREGEPAQLVVKATEEGAGVSLSTVGGQLLADLGPSDGRTFAALLQQQAGLVARANDLLALRTDPATAQLEFCISNDLTYPTDKCPPLKLGKRRVLAQDRNVRAVVHNLAPAKRYVYAWGIDPQFGVTLVYPEGGSAAPMDSEHPTARPEALEPDSPGHYRFVTLATDSPIDARAFEQGGTGARGKPECANPLQRALCAAASGSRDPSAPRVGDWTAIVTDVDVK